LSLVLVILARKNFASKKPPFWQPGYGPGTPSSGNESTNKLIAEDDPVLAETWDNEQDAAYDRI
jgi:hypothetical protein